MAGSAWQNHKQEHRAIARITGVQLHGRAFRALSAGGLRLAHMCAPLKVSAATNPQLQTVRSSRTEPRMLQSNDAFAVQHNRGLLTNLCIRCYQACTLLSGMTFGSFCMQYGYLLQLTWLLSDKRSIDRLLPATKACFTVARMRYGFQKPVHECG